MSKIIYLCGLNCNDYILNYMASLQTLRNKGGVIVAVIIGIALIAFVLGDMLTSGSTLFGSDRNNIGQIDGTTITSQQYSQQLNTITEVQKFMTGSETISEEQSQALQAQAWEHFVRQYAVDPMLKDAGITISDSEMEDLLAGANISPIVGQAFSNPQTGDFDLNYMRQFIAQIDQDQTGRMAMFWNYLQNQVRSQALILKYKTIIDKGVYITAQQAGFMAALESSSYNVRFVAQNLSSVSDSTITVSDDEAKNYYKDNLATFERTVSRSIEYVIFETTPSESDYEQAAQYIESLKNEFSTSLNVEQFVSLNSQSPFDSRYYSQGELQDSLGHFAFNATTQDVYCPEISGNEYTMARISDVKIMPDSVNFSIIAVQSKATADSLVDVIRKGEDFAAVATANSLEPQSGARGGLIGSIDPQTMPKDISDALFNTPKGGLTVVSTENGTMVIKVNEKIGESKKVQLGVIRYAVEPSSETRSESFALANKFNSALGGKSFDDVAKEQSLVKRNANLTGMQRELQGVQGSREAVRWAFNAEKIGDNSSVFEFGDNFLIATLTSVTDKGVAPFEDVKKSVIAKIQEQKKGEMIAKNMSGESSLENLSQKIEQPIIDGNDINFSTFIAPEVGFDPAFAGGVCAITGNELSKPIIGGVAVYVAQVVGKTDNPVSSSMTRERLTAETLQNAFMGAYQTMIKQSSIKDERYKFY